MITCHFYEFDQKKLEDWRTWCKWNRIQMISEVSSYSKQILIFKGRKLEKVLRRAKEKNVLIFGIGLAD